MSTDSKIIPCLWFDSEAEEAAAFYVEAFPDGLIAATSRYPESNDNPGGRPRGSVLTVEFEVAGQRFTALNGGPMFVMNPSISFFVYVDGPEQASRLFSDLADGGEVLMPIDSYPWSERYGWVEDRFGVSWQVMAARRAPGDATIVPCLMFAGAQHGRAEEAMREYARIFAGGRIDSVERYAFGEGPTSAVKHGRFVLAGQQMTAMDSHVGHGVTFNEAISLQVMCEDQDELDCYWEALSEGGEKGECGWLKDRFGLSWQVAPTAIAEWMATEDAVARDRAFAALLQMKKLDIAALKRAYETSVG
jgi:predicted 3-demethylubiquinone-9 3-methyltransferase (glyoxalase superfamily)